MTKGDFEGLADKALHFLAVYQLPLDFVAQLPALLRRASCRTGVLDMTPRQIGGVSAQQHSQADCGKSVFLIVVTTYSRTTAFLSEIIMLNEQKSL